MLIDTLISVGGIALVVVLTWWLNRGRVRPVLDADAAIRIADAAIAGFAADTAVVDGDSARVSGRDGSVVLIRPHGDHWTVRQV